MSVDREDQIDQFLKRADWADAERNLLAGDASFRRYDRLKKPSGSAVLMDAPPPHEDVRPFIRIAQHLIDHGFSVPEILAEDRDAGLLLLEDLGDSTYTKLLSQGHSERELYTLAVDTLIALHSTPEDKVVPPNVQTYGMPRLLEEVGRLLEWYFPLVDLPPLQSDEKNAFEALWRDLLPRAWAVPSSLILFDYHVDNLLWLPDRPGIKACGLLDFQDAVVGPVTYDLMSLLEDARRDVNQELISDLKARYLSAFSSLDKDAFDASWAIMAAQRHVRVLGTFARLKIRDGKPHYLQHIPRLWRYMDACLSHPMLKDLKAWMDTHIPNSQRSLPA